MFIDSLQKVPEIVGTQYVISAIEQVEVHSKLQSRACTACLKIHIRLGKLASVNGNNDMSSHSSITIVDL